ncbi:MAG: hypothetical protein AB7S75_13920 [Desulfococcaceae bacterium]
MKNNGQIFLPFLKRETFFSGRSHTQVRIPFPLIIKDMAGISKQPILFSENPENTIIFSEKYGLMEEMM